MKTMQKFMTALATLVMAFSLTANFEITTSEITDETEIEIEFQLENGKKEPNSSINCDKPIVEIDENEDF